MTDSLTTTWVEPHWCPLHQFILLTKQPIPEIFAKKCWELAVLKNSFFCVSHFGIFLEFFWNFFGKTSNMYISAPILDPNVALLGNWAISGNKKREWSLFCELYIGYLHSSFRLKNQCFLFLFLSHLRNFAFTKVQIQNKALSKIVDCGL